MQVNEKRREIQQGAVEALARSNYYGQAILPTGTGKGWVMVECLKKLNPQGRIWYLCDSTDNRDTTFRVELEKWGAADWIERIEFMCYQTACKLSEEEVELCLADESDAALTPVYSKSFTENKFKHLIMVSATLAGEKRSLAKSIAPIVFEKHLQEIESAGILNGARHYFVNFMLSEDENEQYLKYNAQFRNLLDDPSPRNKGKLEMLQIQRKQFMSSLKSARNICRKLLGELYPDETRKILVFCGLSEQADAICKYSYHSKSEYNFLAPFDRGDIRVLSVVGKIDRGVNLDGVNTVIFESPVKSPTKYVQKTGRARRLPVEQTVDIFYLVPYYVTKWGRTEPTVVLKWIEQATEKLHIKAENYRLKP